MTGARVQEILLHAKAPDFPSGSPDVRRAGNAIGGQIPERVHPDPVGLQRSPDLLDVNRILDQAQGAGAEPAEIVGVFDDRIAKPQDHVGVLLFARGLEELDRGFVPVELDDRDLLLSRAIADLGDLDDRFGLPGGDGMRADEPFDGALRRAGGNKRADDEPAEVVHCPAVKQQEFAAVHGLNGQALQVRSGCDRKFRPVAEGIDLVVAVGDGPRPFAWRGKMPNWSPITRDSAAGGVAAGESSAREASETGRAVMMLA